MTKKDNAEVMEQIDSTPETAPSNETRQVRMRFDDRQMATHYANVANVGMSKDEVTLLFGTNQTWGAIGDEIVIALSTRIIMTPSVARNLVDTLQRVLQEYDNRLGRPLPQ